MEREKERDRNQRALGKTEQGYHSKDYFNMTFEDFNILKFLDPTFKPFTQQLFI